MTSANLGNLSVTELFRLEVDAQVPAFSAALMVLDGDALNANGLETCMRCAHSLKGAGSIVGLGSVVKLAHAMEEIFVEGQQQQIVLEREHIDILLRGVDLLQDIAYAPEAEIARWQDAEAPAVAAYITDLEQAKKAARKHDTSPSVLLPEPVAEVPNMASQQAASNETRTLRVAAENMDRLLGLASESLVASRWLKSFAESLLQLKRTQASSLKSVEQLGQLLSGCSIAEEVHEVLADISRHQREVERLLLHRINELEAFGQRNTEVSERLYEQALASRMRPFADGVTMFPRMVRDLGRELNKNVTLSITGLTTKVDREILEKLEAPLTHLLRNAVDHGIESPQERSRLGKPEEALIQLNASHQAGMLLITIADDGRGISGESLRQQVVDRGLANADTAGKLSQAELLEFLFLPGFSLKEEVNHISGRGVGLDIVQHMVKQVRGSIQIETEAGRGTCFRLQLPLTMSVMRTLLVEIDAEPYAFPLSRLKHTVKLHKSQIEELEGKQCFTFNGQLIGLVAAHQILQVPTPVFTKELAVVILGDANQLVGLIVDKFLGEQELVVQPLDRRLGKIKDIAAGALLEDGSPALIVDVDDVVHSINRLVEQASLQRTNMQPTNLPARKNKRILVVDDSLTVRELERKLLASHGYDAEVALDGLDGWNAVRTSHFDLIVTDIDMPRMDGIELVTLIKQHPELKSIPVLVVSYKDREEDRKRGLDAGADYYLAKGGFHNERLIAAVKDLIGGAHT